MLWVVATPTGLEPVASSVTGWRDTLLHQGAIFCSYWSLIRVHLGFEPARRVALVPKTSVSAIPPHRHMVRKAGLEPARARTH